MEDQLIEILDKLNSISNKLDQLIKLTKTDKNHMLSQLLGIKESEITHFIALYGLLTGIEAQQTLIMNNFSPKRELEITGHKICSG